MNGAYASIGEEERILERLILNAKGDFAYFHIKPSVGGAGQWQKEKMHKHNNFFMVAPLSKI